MNTLPGSPTPNSSFGLPKTEPLATWSLVLGILSLACFSVLAGIPAIVLGKSARTKIDNSNGLLVGSEMATIGIVLGWVSIGITIASMVFMVLVMAGTVSLAFLAQKAPKFQQMAAQPTVEAAGSRVQTAYLRYLREHGSIPSLAAGEDEEVDTNTLIAALSTADANGVPYYSTTGTGIHFNGIPCDTWGQPLHFAIDLNGDGKVTVHGIDLPRSFVTWSSGPNGRNDHGTLDDVITWLPSPDTSR
jgi:Domain of unknown function (DUF4190)